MATLSQMVKSAEEEFRATLETLPSRVPTETVLQQQHFTSGSLSSNSPTSFVSNLSLEDMLDRSGVSNEMLVSNAIRENRAFAALPSNKAVNRSPLPPQARTAAVRTMLCMQKNASASHRDWFQSVAVFDAYCARKPEGVSVDRLPLLCVALVRLQAKSEGTRLVDVHDNFVFASKLALSLQRLGLDARWEEPADFIGELKRQEIDVMRVLDWRIQLPSAESWLSWFIVRFNTLSSGSFADSLSWAWHQGVRSLHCQVPIRPSTGAFPNRHQAHGLLALLVVRAGLLPLESLRPSGVDSTAWQQLYMRGLNLEEAPQCNLQAAQLCIVVDMFLKSTGLSADVMRRDAYQVVLQMQVQPQVEQQQQQQQDQVFRQQ